MAYYVKDEANRKKLEDTLTELLCGNSIVGAQTDIMERVREIERALDWTENTKRTEHPIVCPLADYMNVSEDGKNIFITFATGLTNEEEENDEPEVAEKVE